jgi:hypothetical protein
LQPSTWTLLACAIRNSRQRGGSGSRLRAAAESLVPPFRQLIREISVDLPQRATGVRLALDYLVLEASRLHERSASPLVTLHPAVARAENCSTGSRNAPGHWMIWRA